MVLGDEVQPRLCGPLRAATGLLPGANARDRLLQLIALLARVVGGVDERRKAVHLVRLQHLHAHRRGGDEHSSYRGHGEKAEDREVRPFRPRDEQHRAGDRHVDERRAEVRLRHHQDRRHDGQQEDPAGRVDLRELSHPFDHEGRERHDEHDLP